MNAVFDTNIVIDALNGVASVDAEYRRYARVLISLITWMEVLVGAEKDETSVRRFLADTFEIMPLDMAVAERAIQLRRACRLRLPDALIWATAQIHDAVLVTRNTKDFHADWEGVRVPYRL